MTGKGAQAAVTREKADAGRDRSERASGADAAAGDRERPCGERHGPAYGQQELARARARQAREADDLTLASLA